MNANPRPVGSGLLRTLLLLLLALFAPSVLAQTGVSFKIEGCRNDGSITLPNGGGEFICPDAAYTTGNLGKGWNELDLVPHRITANAGNSAPASQTYTIGAAADNCDGASGTIYTCADGESLTPGYDVMSAPVLNTALSDASCTPLSSSAQLAAHPGVGGTAVSIYRLLTITQAANTTCVYDYYERLALGSHLYPGSSLHSDLLNQSLGTAGIGAKDVSIPVNEISPQGLSKTMAASADSSVTWDLIKSGNPTSVHFGDVCAANAPTSQPVTITITWTKNPATLGKVSVTTHVFATNPAARTITVNVTDKIYKDLVQTTLLDTASTPLAGVDVPAGQTVMVLTHTALFDSSVAGGIGDWLNDVATATYTDKATGIPVPGTTTAAANAQIAAGTTFNGTADISDSESISGNGLTFSVPTPPSVGSFLNGYAGSATTGPVNWNALAQSSSGSVTFNKTIYLANQTVTSGTLSDTAHLNTASQQLSAPVSVGIDSSATVKLTVSKTIPANYLALSGDKLTVDFHIAGTATSNYTNDIHFTFLYGGSNTASQTISGLLPDSYTVTETGSKYCDAQNNCTTQTLLQPIANPLVVDLTPQNGSMAGRCTGTAPFTNTLLAQGVRVQVQKITNPVLTAADPDYNWQFTLNGPNVGSCVPATAGAGAGFVLFQDSLGGDCLLSDGNYTVTETLKSGWREDSAVPNNGVNTLICAFSVNTILNDGQTFSCTFHNTRLGHVKVIKTVSGNPPGVNDAFVFELHSGAAAGVPGSVLESQTANAGNGGVLNFATLLTPGSHYQLCEIVKVGWGTNLPNPFTAAQIDADNSLICSDFVATTDVFTFTVNNTPPPNNKGSARTIGYWKNWASCHNSNGHQEPVLDETLLAATPPGIQVGNFYLTTGQCVYAVNLLNKSTMTTGIKMASDPLFNMTAQLVAAELNEVAGAASCASADSAIVQANALLSKYAFNGNSYSPKLSKADATLANSLANTLDMYNNNLLCF